MAALYTNARVLFNTVQACRIVITGALSGCIYTVFGVVSKVPGGKAGARADALERMKRGLWRLAGMVAYVRRRPVREAENQV